MDKIIFHTDKHCRKGRHPVTMTTMYRGKEEEHHIFSVDEPGARWGDKWNLHVNGCNYALRTWQDCIVEGLRVLGYLKIEEE